MTDFTYHCACCGGRHIRVQPSDRFPFVCDGCSQAYPELELQGALFREVLVKARQQFEAK